MTRIPLWVDLRHVSVQKRLPYLAAVRDCGVEVVVLAPGDPHAARPDVPARIQEGDVVLPGPDGPEALRITLATAADQARALRVSGPVVIDAHDWRIVPLENLLAGRSGPTYAVARDADDAAVLTEVLDGGVDGVVLVPRDARAIHAVHAVLETKAHAQPRPPPRADRFLAEAVVTEVRDAGPGDRVCVDATSAFRDGEGLLVGATAASFALVLAETADSPFIAARPFRVNAGALHAYLFAGGRTCYLSEVSATTPLLAVHPDGVHRVLQAGRAKVERRPHTLVRWRTPAGRGFAVLQTAETVCLAGADGGRIPVTSIKAGARILVHDEAAARHAGMPIGQPVREH